ncbi:MULTISPECIES: isopenicillin N synthase family oxygenase [unclassified Marinobacterium]|jgi:isopenicillin N synthase-like dioxygenase|uniref:isopenicillin N synthase family dioxygenase n=1 Tax=unclassified Marinobacterium TaxID=2644139 RepID=UPI001569C4B6|nr:MULTISPECIES: isopenicillin N synthase family oxygenase [unclassified Marinobacterium]NRP57311.1 2OG-Fe(II) oxygenase superfamily protein [Marinobacterium sp. xm-d-510]NRP97823.1 2OG-Fe(II) oxygenase superfamily protein [Marinobacterium sp. xm-a-127]
MSNFLEAVDYQSEGASEAFVKSLHETGFGVLKNHPIAEAQVRAIYDHWQAFFNSDRKSDFDYNVGTQDGFFSSKISEVAKDHTVKDIKEYFHYYPWGQCPEDLREELQAYYSQTSSLASELLGWVEAFSPEEVRAGYREPLPNMINGSEQTLLRVLHYPPFDGNEEPGAIRAAAHGDINLLTILPAASEPGLQVLSKTGEWLDVPAEFGNLIVNIGDMLQEASAGYFPSTIHRVINPVGGATKKSRISLPLFLHPRPDVVLSDRYTADSYLKERLKELGVI